MRAGIDERLQSLACEGNGVGRGDADRVEPECGGLIRKTRDKRVRRAQKSRSI